MSRNRGFWLLIYVLALFNVAAWTFAATALGLDDEWGKCWLAIGVATAAVMVCGYAFHRGTWHKG